MAELTLFQHHTACFDRHTGERKYTEAEGV